MAVTPNSLVSVQSPKSVGVQFSTADSTGVNKAAYTGGQNGSKIVGLYATNSDSAAAHLLTLQLQRVIAGSTTNFGGVAVSIPLSAGFTAAAPPVNVMASTNWIGLPFDNDGNPFLFLASTTEILTVTYGTTLTAATVVNLAGVAGDF